MNKAQTTLFGMVVGAGLVYFLDPERGTRRRAQVRDQLSHARHELEDAALTRARHVRNRAGGLLHEARAGVLERGVEDRVLEERVRSAIGRLVSRPAAITVIAQDGEVLLRGEVPSQEVQEMVRAVKATRGVQHVDNQLTVHTRAPGTEASAEDAFRGAEYGRS